MLTMELVDEVLAEEGVAQEALDEGVYDAVLVVRIYNKMLAGGWRCSLKRGLLKRRSLRG